MSIFINEPSLGLFSLDLFECIVNHEQKGQDSDTSQAVAQTSFLSGVNLHKSTGATDVRSKEGGGGIIRGCFLIAAPRREGAPCRVLEGCADGVSAAYIHLRSAIAPAAEAPVPLDLTGEGSSKCDR